MANVIASIAMEEVSLSKVINAETEKVKHVADDLASDDSALSSDTIDPLSEIMDSVKDMIAAVGDIENALKVKLACALEGIPEEDL